MDTFPPELLLYIIQFLPFTSLIAARGVDTKWRSFAQTASLHPARKALLDLYLAAIVHPNFSSLVEALQPHVRVFDREAYIAGLTSRGCVLPDIFEFWVLEWPSKAIYFPGWPGLSRGLRIDHDYYFYGRDFSNLLAYPTPTIGTIPLPQKEATSIGMACQGLGLCEALLGIGGGAVQLWLVVNAGERLNDRLVGRLVWTHLQCVDELIGCGEERPMGNCYDHPFVVENMIELLSLLDLRHSCVASRLRRYYLGGIQDER